MVIEIRTLVDITRTGVTRPSQGSQLDIDQNRNFTTLLQCAELRSIVNFDTAPTVEKVDVKGMGFGSNYKGKHQVWTFKFSPDRQGVYTDSEGNLVGFLVSDMHSVPIIKNLTETINIGTAIFDLKDSKCKNTIIKALSGNEQASRL
jgi:hypothetical protein